MSDAIEQRVRLMASRLIVTAIDDSRAFQELQVDLLDDEAMDGVEHFQPYGLTAHPHPEAEGLLLAPGGLRSAGIAFNVGDRRYRLTGLQQGEVALHDDQGQKVLIGRDGIRIETALDITIAGAAVAIEADSVTIDAGSIALGEGGAAIARVGDDVDPGTHKIVSGSSVVTAA